MAMRPSAQARDVIWSVFKTQYEANLRSDLALLPDGTNGLPDPLHAQRVSILHVCPCVTSRRAHRG